MSIDLHQLDAFRDGAIHPRERAAVDRIMRAEREKEDRRRGCRIGQVIDRRPPEARMAEVMARVWRAKGCCLEEDLIEAGFTPEECRRHRPVARRLCRDLLTRDQSRGAA